MRKPVSAFRNALQRRLDHFHFSLRNAAVAKGQKKSNKEVRKPKADKPKTPVIAVSSFLTPPTAKKK
jgi:hypothetical protein